MNRDHGRPGSLARQAPRRRRLRPSPEGRRVAWRLIVVLGALAGGLTLWFGLRGRGADPVAEPSSHTARAAIADALAGAPEPESIASPEELAAAADGEDGSRALAEVIEAEGPGPIDPDPVGYAFGPPDPFNSIVVNVERGETLFQALMRGGVSRAEAGRIVAALRSHVNFAALRPGDRFDGVFWLDDELIEGTFRNGVRDRWRVRNQGGSLIAAADPVAVRRVTEVVRGIVDSSLFQAIQAAGERPQLIMSFVNLFRWDFDFGMQTRRGDRFEMLVEKEFIDDRFHGYGPILAARYHGSGEQLAACWFDEGGSGANGYYHADGRSVRRAFLRSPVEFSRISSRFSKSRLHPTLGIRRPHSGVDYAAPMGTPVFTVGDGLVIDAGRMGGAGLAVRVRHNNGWITSYSHLSKILVRKGERVKQGQMIGRVGSTGYSTGPHLDFRVKIGQQFVDPLKVDYPKGDPVPQHLLARFRSSCGEAVARIEADVRMAALAD